MNAWARWKSLAELVHAVRQAFAEEGVERDPENQVSTDGVEVDRVGDFPIADLGDDPVDRCVAAFDDHGHPTVEAGTRERSLYGAAATSVVGAVGHDHRSFTDDEANTDDVELVAPSEGVGLHREDLVRQCRVADDDDSHSGYPQLADRPIGGVEFVEGRSEMVEQVNETTEVRSSTWSRDRPGRMLIGLLSAMRVEVMVALYDLGDIADEGNRREQRHDARQGDSSYPSHPAGHR